MKKFKLDLDALEVDSFEAVAQLADVRGTVQANQTDIYEECGTLYSGCCQEASEYPGDCGIQSQECVTAGFDCTWHPVLMCFSNPIAFPTEPRCDDNCWV